MRRTPPNDVPVRVRPTRRYGRPVGTAFNKQIRFLFSILLFFRKAFGVPQFRYDFDVERQVVPDTFGIFFYACNEMRVVRLADNE